MCKNFLLLATCLISTICTALPQQQRIAGGVEARLGQDPYIAAVLFAEDNVNFRVICGGAIINNRSVLTATTCWMYAQVKQLRVRVGSIYANSGGTVRNVDFVIFHPGYDSWNRDNNICLLRVNSVIPFGNNVQPIGITIPDFDLNINTPVLTMGWGQTSVNGPSYSNKLHRVEIRTFSHVNCRNIYGVNFITNNHICAGWSYTPARGACAGDIGSPLVYGNVVVGVTSLITGCGDRNFPATYMWIPRYSNWIQNNA